MTIFDSGSCYIKGGDTVFSAKKVTTAYSIYIMVVAVGRNISIYIYCVLYA